MDKDCKTKSDHIKGPVVHDRPGLWQGEVYLGQPPFPLGDTRGKVIVGAVFTDNGPSRWMSGQEWLQVRTGKFCK